MGKNAPRIGRTAGALIARGFSDELANSLQADGHTLAQLKQAPDSQLLGYGLKVQNIASLRDGARPPIPAESVAKVLWASRFMCCVCRQEGKAIVLHHISPWAKSHDHSTTNLTALCLEHHAQAHRTGQLEQNLSPTLLRDFKEKWENEARMLDTIAIMEASWVPSFHWWWFNHVRVLDIARDLKIPITKNGHFWGAQRHAQMEDDGSFSDATLRRRFLYQGGNGILLYEFMRRVLHSVLDQTPIFDISNDLDRSTLSRVLNIGDIVLVRGRHHFKMLERHHEGPGQASRVTRTTNGVSITFNVDRWESVSNSSWAGWLRGTQSASTILRVVSVESEEDVLHVKGTALAIGGQMSGLRTRSYFSASCPQTRYADEIDEDDDM